MEKCCKEQFDNSCCCNCANHLEDFHHCATTSRDENECVCSNHKGWVCCPPMESDGKKIVYSGWSEHGMCELWCGVNY